MTSDFYTGNIVNLQRQGLGVYVYKNRYFTYEGNWINGKKHGNGRLTMGDGSYYEGEFYNGEICGKGVRWQASLGNLYEGEMVMGEANGMGVMKYSDGGQYEGHWANNKRQGYGTLINGVEIYEGSFYNNKRHGEGQQTYKDGSSYSGNWVSDLAQGHGTMFYPDGSMYEGQWLQGARNGEGIFNHLSGMRFEGMWSFNLPTQLPIKLKFANKETINIKQTELFDVCLFSLDGCDQLCPLDDGREILLFGGKLLPLSSSISVHQTNLNLGNINLDDKSIKSDKSNTKNEDSFVSTSTSNICENKKLEIGPKSTPSIPISFDVMRTNHLNLCLQHLQKLNYDQLHSTYETPYGKAEKSCQLIYKSNFIDEDEFKNSTNKEKDHIVSDIISQNQDLDHQSSRSEESNLTGIVGSVKTSKIDHELGDNNNDKSKIKKEENIEEPSFAVENKDVNHWLPINSLYIRNGCLEVQNMCMKNMQAEENIFLKENESNNEEENISFVSAGEYVLTAIDVTRPPFLGFLLEPAFIKITIT